MSGSAIALKGLSWGHRRATGPLAPMSAAFAALRPDVEIVWTERPLAGFEHQPIAEAARAYDLVIFDHPFCGDIVASGAFLPLDKALPDLLGPEAGPLYVGPTLASYRFGGAVWGAPIDAASEHAIYRADVMKSASEAIPLSWSEVVRLGRRLNARGLYLGAAVVAPHLGLVAAALMANRCLPWTTDPDGPFRVDRDGLREALERLAELVVYCPRQALGWNSIDLHEAMVARDDIAYAPCVYGYATYGEADRARRLSFADFPGLTAPYAAGSAIGGAAIGVSARTKHPDACLDFLRFALGAKAQTEIVGRHHGQPARAEAWNDSSLDEAFNGYFSGVRSSMDLAWVRPRRRGYIPFQHEVGRVVESFAKRETALVPALDEIEALARRLGQDA